MAKNLAWVELLKGPYATFYFFYFIIGPVLMICAFIEQNFNTVSFGPPIFIPGYFCNPPFKTDISKCIAF